MPQVFVKTQRARPSANADGSQIQMRGSRYAEPHVVPISAGLYGIADEGSYFRAVNPTPGTGIAQTIQTSFLATNGILSLRNAESAGGKRYFLDYIRLINTVVGATTTRSEGLIAVDNITRYSSGGSQITALPNANMDDSTVSAGVLHFGALTLAAESANVRRLSRFQLRNAIMVQFEEFVINFGGMDSAPGTLGGTTGLRAAVCVGPVIIGPGQCMVLHLWNPGNATTAPSWELEMGWWER